MTTQVEMKSRICPFLSDSRNMVMCQGDECNAFNSRPAYVYLGKEGKATIEWSQRATFVPEGVQASLVKEIIDKGWTQQGSGTNRSKVSFRREGEPTCWCDAMPANMEYQGGGQ